MRWAVLGSAVLGLAAALALAPASSAQASQCGRSCLAKALDKYLAGVVAHDPSKAGLGPQARETENGAERAPGAGVWVSARGLGAVQRRYLDPVSGQAAYFGLIEEANGAEPAIVSLRIKVERRKVAEAEWIVARKGMALYAPAGLIAEPPAQTAQPRKGRATRAQLAAAADSYFEGLQRHDGARVLNNPGCVRLENGTKVTQRRAPPAIDSAAVPAVEFAGADCASGFERMMQIDKVVLRRYPVIDEEAGVAMGVAMFLRPPGGARRADGSVWPRLLLAEYFTTRNARITGIYAAMHYLPDDAPQSTGWDKNQADAGN